MARIPPRRDRYCDPCRCVNSDNNYQYDALGNLIHDKREEIETIEWTVSGKVKRITRTPGSTKPPLEFAYGADGQRISKTIGDPLNGGYREYYLRDAQGNIMAMYRHHLIPVPNTDPQEYEASLKVTERPVYGSSRIGSYTRQMELVGGQAIINYPYTQPMQAPLKRYELTDHLGNVNTVVTGRLLDGAGSGSPKQAEVVSAQGYEAFGSLLPGRNYSSDSYRFGFQGQEKDDEIYGATGTSYAFEYRMHDARVGRFLSIDPLWAKYPWNSPYAFSENRMMDMVELEGLEAAPTPDKAEDPKSDLPNGGEGWTEGQVIDAGDGFGLSSHSFKGPKPGSGGNSAVTNLMPSAPGASKSGDGSSVSSSMPKSYSLPYTVPALTQSQENTSFATSLFGVGSLMMNGTEKALKVSAANTQFRYAARSATGKIMSAAEATAATKISLQSAAGIAKTAGRAFGLLGVGATVYDALGDGNITEGDVFKIGVGFVTTFSPFGWAYGAIDIGVSLYTGKSLTDRAAEMIDRW